MKSDRPRNQIGGFAAAVQAALGISPCHADILSPLASAVELQRGLISADSKEFKNARAVLVDALNKGARPDALTRMLVDQASIIGPAGEPFLDETTWHWGSFYNRIHLQRWLWEDATFLKSVDASRASASAKACILLAAHDDFAAICWAGTNRCVRWREEFKTLAVLDEIHSTRLTEAVTRRQQLDHYLIEQEIALFKAMDRLSEDSAPSSFPERLQATLSLLESCWEIASRDTGQTWDIANLAWYTHNITRMRQDPQESASVEGLLQRWRSEANETHVQRWLTEAIERVGPGPGRLCTTVP